MATNEIFDGQMDPTSFRRLMNDAQDAQLKRRAEYLAANPDRIPCGVPGCRGTTTANQAYNINRYEPALPAIYACPRTAIHARLFPDLFRITSVRSAGVAPDTDELDEPAAKARNGKEAVTA